MSWFDDEDGKLKKANEEQAAARSGALDVLASIPKKFVEGAKDIGNRFVEGAQMVGALPGEPHYTKDVEAAEAAAKPAPDESEGLDSNLPPSVTQAPKQDWQDATNNGASMANARANPGQYPLAAKKKVLAKMRGTVAQDAPAVQAPDQPYEDPMAKLNAMNMQDRADLATAQAASRKAADAAMAHSYAEQALHSGTGVAVDENSIRLKNAEIARPLQELGERRQIGKENLDQFKKQTDLQEQLAEDDPNDPVARKAAAYFVSKGMIPAAAAKNVTRRSMKYLMQGVDWQTSQNKAAEESRWHNQESADKRRGQDMSLMEAQIRAQATGGPKALHMDKASSKNLQTIDTLEAELRKMPTSWDPRDMYAWTSRINDLGATMVGAGRLNQVLMQNIKNFSPEWYNTPGRREKLLGDMLSMTREARASILDQQEASGVDPTAIQRQRDLYDGKYGQSRGTSPQRSGWEHMPDGTKFPIDAQGNRLGPAVR